MSLPLGVVLVEDSPKLRERLEEALAGIDGVRVLDSADSEGTAVEVIRRQRPDAVVLDLHLREGTGFGVLRELAEDRGRRPTFIVLTNFDLPEYRRMAAELGVEHFLDKAREYDRLPQLLLQLRRCLA